MPDAKPSLVTLVPADLHDDAAALRAANIAFAAGYPGEVAARQPVHTVYGGAQLFRPDSAQKLGALARAALAEYAPDAATLGRALRIEKHPALATIYQRLSEKLAREAVEDFRIDFEDGYGNRPDAEEDGHAVAVGEALATAMRDGTLPPFIGSRIKPLNEEMCARS
ncbi:MAG: phosphoenolpyruvate kinase, partial [Gemmatimonadaceae bacterium]